MPTPTITVRLEQQLQDAITAHIADNQDKTNMELSRSSIIRDALASYLEGNHA